MDNPNLAHLSYKICNTKLQTWPFDHFYIQEAFSPDFYKKLLYSLPSIDSYKEVEGRYQGRKFAQVPTPNSLNFLLSYDFLRSVIYIFERGFQKRFPSGNFKPKTDLRLILDGENYSIGPHTDAKWKVVSLLFYLPKDDSLEEHGTSLYVPKDDTFRCAGGPHHKFEQFQRVHTAPFLPNSCLGFFKTDYAFHGVEPIKQECRRDILLWNLYDANEMK